MGRVLVLVVQHAFHRKGFSIYVSVSNTHYRTFCSLEFLFLDGAELGAHSEELDNVGILARSRCVWYQRSFSTGN